MLERLCSVADVPEGTARRFELGALAIAVAHIGDAWFAIGDRCTHQDVSLSEGDLDTAACTLECPKHGSCFSLETGVPGSLPATRPVSTYVVRIDDDAVFVEVD